MSTGVITFERIGPRQLRPRASWLGAVLLFVSLAGGSLAQDQSEAPNPSPPTRSVRIRFLPPPLDGAITLGIYDEWDQLVRVLRQDAEIEEFEVGADALSTRWDGKDDDGNELPSGDYHARGYIVAPMKIEENVASNETPVAAASVRVKLVANPLENDKRPSIDLAAGFDDEDAFLKTTDGLPLLTIASTDSETKRVWLTAGRENKIITAYLENAAGVRQFRITGIEKMMAFDGGEFELK